MANGLEEEICTRWTHSNTATGNAFLGSGKSAPFGINGDGLTDLRGLCINQFLKNATVRCVDLSGSYMDGFGQFGFCNVSESRLAGARLGTNLGNKFTRCDFSHSDLSGAVLRGEFDEVDFTGARMNSTNANQVLFRRCRFVQTVLRKATLLNCTFEDCVFDRCSFGSGSIAGSKFIRSSLALDELKKTVIENVVFADSIS